MKPQRSITLRTPVLLLATSLLVLPTAILAQSAGEPGRDSAGPNPLRNVYFGEQHIHTGNSPDAFATGGRSSWDDVYRYAMGEEITFRTVGQQFKIKKSTPYDFVGLTDHAEYFGVMPRLIDTSDPLSQTEFAQKFRDPNADPSAPDSAINQILGSILTSTAMPEFVTPELLKENWSRYVETANKYNQPGKFTTLIAWEWTSIPNGRNMHRNVYFRDDGPAAPFSAFDSIHPEDLWTFQEIQRNLGHENLAIPHNGNVSDGWMYAPNKFLGGPIDARYAERQARNEPVTEMTQTKGTSETHPVFSPTDEFAGFELFHNLINVGQPGQVKYGYVRQGLAEGMALEQELGSNPYKMGFVSGADSHSGYSNNEEFNFVGSHGGVDDTVEKRLDERVNPSGGTGPEVSTGGTTAVWAEENTRESIFDGIKRKETYGTSGTLIRLRFFGGWNYSQGLTSDDDFVRKAYDAGVPMGGDLPPMPGASNTPTFAVWALKDPESGNLDRIQIIKVWVNKWGRSSEKIYDVALSDGRKVDPESGKAPPVGNTVNVQNATYTNDIGDSQLMAVWRDTEFDPSVPTAYYARVIEIPTPRWSTYDAVRNNMPLPTTQPATIQERAWSSPIWYTPAKN